MIGVERIVEQTLEEDIILEDIQVEIILQDDIDGLFDEYFLYNGAAGEYDIDWFKVIGQFSAGTAIIVVTGVASYFTAEIPGVGYIFATSCKEALKQAVIGAAVGAALNAAIGALKSGGKVDAVTKYAIEGAANGFMWGAITGALTGAFSGYIDYFKNTNKVFDGNKLLGTIDNNGQIINGKEVVGFKTQNGFIVDTAGKVLGYADDAGNITAAFTSLIPSSGQILNSTGKSVKYVINSANQVLNSSGKVVGTINEAGQIVDSAGYIMGQLDDAGRLVAGVTKAVNAGFKINPSGAIANGTKIINGVTQYLDDAGNVIGKLVQCQNSAGKTINYITANVNSASVKYIGDLPADGLSKVVGQLDDAGNLVSNWTKIFQAERSRGVALAWKEEKALVEATGRGTRDWTAAEIAELLSKGKVSGYQGHHINSALYSPTLASNPNNIIFYSAADHLSIGHAGNYQIITFGKLLSRVF